MSVTEGEQSDVWPPEPTAQPVLIEVGPWRVEVGTQRLYIENRMAKWVLWVFALVNLVIEAIIIGTFYHDTAFYHTSGYMTPSQARSDFITLIAQQLFLLSGISWLIVGLLNEIKPFTADRFQDVLMINRKKVGSVSALQALEIQLRPGKSSPKLYALVSHSRKPEGKRYLITTRFSTESQVRQLADLIAEFAGVPVEMK